MTPRQILLPALSLVLGACAGPPPPPPRPTAPSEITAQLLTRSLGDEGLQRFLRENLGQVPATWDFEALSWAAFYFHPSLEVARAQWAAARAKVQTADARSNPVVSLGPGYNSTREPGVSPWFPSISFDFLLPTSPQRARLQEGARADAEMARLTVFTAAWQVRSELRAALAQVATATQRAAALREQAGAQRELLALLERRLASGFATAAEVSAARLACLRAETALTEAAQQHTLALARTAAALGVPRTALTGVALPGPTAGSALPALTLTDLLRQSLHARADVLTALAKLQSTEAALGGEVAKQQPDFHLGPGYQWDQGANKWNVTLSFELPLFHRNEGPVAEATARRAEAVAQFTAVQAQAIATIEQAVAAQSGAVTQIEQARRVRAEIAQQNALVQKRLALGAADQVERQTARLELAVADAALAEAESAAALAAGNLEDALQIPFPRLDALAHATPSSKP